ncbi:MAG: alginate export family protein [Myxococcota bacterium]
MRTRIPRLLRATLPLALCCTLSGVGKAATDPSSEESSALWLGLEAERLTEEERSLLRRPDEKRPEDQLTLMVWDRPMVLGWSPELRTKMFDDVAFKDARVDDTTRLAQNLTLDLFYRLNENVSVFLKGAAFYRGTRKEFRGHPLGVRDRRDRERGIARREMWLYLRELAGTPLSFQVGRQRFSEDREWWWDDDLDALRLHFDLSRLHLELGLAELLARVSSSESHIDPEDEKLRRLLARATWEWRRRNRLELFAVRQMDRSDTELVDMEILSEREDESDATLWWTGVSARGTLSIRSAGKLDYWVDSAFVSGHETFLDYTGTLDNRRVRSRTRHGVHGWGVDAGLTWMLPLPLQPALTIGYAIGSGDREGKDLPDKDSQKSTDRSFRQTGLQDNNGRFRGVDRFKYYGELLDPELSNLRIGTLGLGFRLLEQTSLQLLYHVYRQDEPAKFLRDATVRRQPAGRKHRIGQEFDVVLGIEEWDHIEIELIAAAFRAGAAFGEHLDGLNPEDLVPATAGDWSYLGLVKFKLNF